MEYNKTIMIKVDKNFKEMVSDQSHDERTTMSELIRRVMIEYVANKKKGAKK